jgi:hypothetical protein
VDRRAAEAVLRSLGSANKETVPPAAATWSLKVPGKLSSASVTKVEGLKVSAEIAKEYVGMQRLPTRHYSAWEVSGLKTEHSFASAAAADYAAKVIQDGAITDEEYTDWGVDIRDQTFATLGTLTFRTATKVKNVSSGELSEKKSAGYSSVAEWQVEGFGLTSK